MRAVALATIVVFAAPTPAPGAPGPAPAAAAHGAVVSADPTDWTPQVLDGEVKAIAQVGPRIVVGGSFSRVREVGASRTLVRHGLFAFDPATGAVDPRFVPVLDGGVEAVAAAPDGRSVFAGGRFRTRLAKLDLSSGDPVAGFRAVVAGSSVEDLVVHGGRLYLGGGFLAVNGRPRFSLAAVDATTGAVDSALDVPFTEARAGRLRVEKFDVAPDGSRLVAVGNFTRVAGRELHQIAVLDLTSTPATVADWHTDRYQAPCEAKFDTYMRDVDVSPAGSWFMVVTTGARSRPTLCDTAARWELGATGRGLQPTWVDSSGGDSFTGVAVTGAAVYVGGHMRWMNNPYNRGTGVNAQPGPGAVARSGIAALDPTNGLPLSWNPGREPRGAGAFALVPTAEGLWVGSDTDRLGGEYRPRLAFCPLAGGRSAGAAAPAGLPGDLYTLRAGGGVLRRHFDGRTLGPASLVPTGVDWSRARGAFAVGGWLYTGWDDGRLDARPFDGTRLGERREVPLGGLSASQFPVARLSGMFFDNGRLYYTVSGDHRLHYRYFTPESAVVGAESFVAGGEGDGLDWSGVRGLTFASGRIYFARADGSLWSTEFRRGRPVPGTTAPVGDPAGEGAGLDGRGLFLLASAGGDGGRR